jgi:hypothetical protein
MSRRRSVKLKARLSLAEEDMARTSGVAVAVERLPSTPTWTSARAEAEGEVEAETEKILQARGRGVMRLTSGESTIVWNTGRVLAPPGSVKTVPMGRMRICMKGAAASPG